ncbi:hypothetical protein F4779DRAFT_255987 [Xylariaceae sp. FL0662B]|nr:hypothetical protein F4779DRAFT_255987 [Xylariaceae sp. FL0662B]
MPIQGRHHAAELETRPRRGTSSNRIHYFLLVLLPGTILSCILGIIIGAAAVKSYTPYIQTMLQQPNSGLNFHAIDWEFTYNQTYGADPRLDNGTEDAWESIVPLGRGSVRYPADSLQVYTLSAVHQLHCLWSIHRNYYMALHPDPSENAESTFSHMRHCFDYLRQSLTCAADATLEPVDPVLGGVTGWGNPRICRDYSELVAWAEKYRVNNLRGFSGAS